MLKPATRFALGGLSAATRVALGVTACGCCTCFAPTFPNVPLSPSPVNLHITRKEKKKKNLIYLAQNVDNDNRHKEFASQIDQSMCLHCLLYLSWLIMHFAMSLIFVVLGYNFGDVRTKMDGLRGHENKSIITKQFELSQNKIS